MLNTRCEKATFKSAFRKRRCLVPADAFYEWKKVAGGKQPYAVTTTDNGPFGMAGLWEGWKNPDGAWEHTFTLITTKANAAVAELHDRMPVILPPAAWPAWLGEEEASKQELLALLRPYAGSVRLWPVSRDVGNVRNDRPDLVEPLARGAVV